MIDLLGTILAWYPVMNSSDSTDMSTLVQYASAVSRGILFPVILLVVYIISMIGMTFSGQTISRSVLFSGLFCSILAIPLVLLNLLNINYMYFAFFMTAVGIAWTWFAQAQS